ncbi:MAG: 16S rRNA (guanine(527)-N(7))-methyltransferase RsmG [Deltaproteobacteria bacterium]|nr:16S rRNA (guanine(527)-N(7))-methyltransferase RsmG [Deltaproteobacteria bacterium]
MSSAPRPVIELQSSTPLLPSPQFARKLLDAGIEVNPEALARVGDFLARMLVMNERMNLTSITELEAAWERHVFDALTLLPILDRLGPAVRVLDVGSGGGVPGVPIAIARPNFEVTLLEATQKKVSYLKAVVEALALGAVSVEGGRAEALAETRLAGSFDAVTARAVAKLSALIPLTAPFAKIGGIIALIKGRRADEELVEAASALKRFGLTHQSTTQTATGRIVELRKHEPPRQARRSRR